MSDHYKTLGVAAQRERRRDQEGLSQARARDAPRQAPGRSGCRGALQADRAGQRGAVRSREAPAVRPAGRGRHARRRTWRRVRPAHVQPGRHRHLRPARRHLRPRRAGRAARSAAAARPRPRGGRDDLVPRQPERRARLDRGRGAGALHGLPRLRRGAGDGPERRARTATAAACARRPRASSRSRSRACAAAAPVT